MVRHCPFGQFGRGKLNGTNAERRMERLLREAGKVRESFVTERGRWVEALRPTDPDRRDRHLAVIPHPDAVRGIERLASGWGVGASATSNEGEWPCANSSPQMSE